MFLFKLSSFHIHLIVELQSSNIISVFPSVWFKLKLLEKREVFKNSSAWIGFRVSSSSLFSNFLFVKNNFKNHFVVFCHIS